MNFASAILARMAVKPRSEGLVRFEPAAHRRRFNVAFNGQKGHFKLSLDGVGRSVISRTGPRGPEGNLVDTNLSCRALAMVNARRGRGGSRKDAMDRFARPRRRRGQWTLFRVENKAGLVGFLVLDGANRPHPKAFIPGNTPASLKLAAEIDFGGAIRKPAIDLRSVPWSKLPAEIAGTRTLELKIDEGFSRPDTFIGGSVLLPIDSRGRKAVGRADAAILEMRQHGSPEDGMLSILGNLPPWLPETKSGDLNPSETAKPSSKGRNRKAAKRRR